MKREVKCPRCGKSAAFDTTNASRPFCSERCKLIDLGNWADEKYAIPVPDSSNVEAPSQGHSEVYTDAEAYAEVDRGVQTDEKPRINLADDENPHLH